MVFGRKTPVKADPDQKNGAQAPSSMPKTETLWQNATGKKGNESKIDSLLSTLSYLSCEKYINDSSKEDFTNPIYTIQLFGSQKYILSIFAKTDQEAKNYPAVSSENGYPFVLPGWQADKIMKNPDELLEKTNGKD